MFIIYDQQILGAELLRECEHGLQVWDAICLLCSFSRGWVERLERVDSTLHQTLLMVHTEINIIHTTKHRAPKCQVRKITTFWRDLLRGLKRSSERQVRGPQDWALTQSCWAPRLLPVKLLCWENIFPCPQEPSILSAEIFRILWSGPLSPPLLGPAWRALQENLPPDWSGSISTAELKRQCAVWSAFLNWIDLPAL